MEHLHQETKINIGPTTGEFAPGIQIEGHGRFGADYDTEVAPMSDAAKNSAVCFGLRLSLTNSEVGPGAVETLNQLKEMAMSIDPVKEVVDKGLDISFRHEGNSVWINVVVPETLPELQMIPGWDKVSMSGTQFSGKSDWKVTTGLDPTKFLDAKLEDIVDRATHFSVEGNATMEELHHVLTTATKLVQDFLPQEKEVKMALAFVNILTAFRSMNWEFKYDPNVVKSVVNNVMQASGRAEKATARINAGQEMVGGFLPQAQMMAPMFIGPYADLLKSVNLGHYEFFIMVPRLRLYLRPGFTLFGLNQFVNDKFLSS